MFEVYETLETGFMIRSQCIESFNVWGFMILFVKQVTVAYNNDPSPAKLNLGVGAYRTEVVFFY